MRNTVKAEELKQILGDVRIESLTEGDITTINGCCREPFFWGGLYTLILYADTTFSALNRDRMGIWENIYLKYGQE